MNKKKKFKRLEEATDWLMRVKEAFTIQKAIFVQERNYPREIAVEVHFT